MLHAETSLVHLHLQMHVHPSQPTNINSNVSYLKIGTYLKSLGTGVFNPQDPPVFSVSTELDLTSPNLT